MQAFDMRNLDCPEDCPAVELRNIARISEVESLRRKAFDDLAVPPRLIVLCESTPPDRFVYDRRSRYANSGLRANLRKELVDCESDEALFDFMNTRGIWIVDAALCPLHEGRRLSNKQRRLAATTCLRMHTSAYLEQFPALPIVAIFPSNCGFLRKQLPDLNRRIVRWFGFSDLTGLRQAMDDLA